MYLYTPAANRSFTMTNTIVRDNRSRDGGGIARNRENFTLHILENTVISDNFASRLGGGIWAGEPGTGGVGAPSVNLNRGSLNIADTVVFEGNRSGMSPHSNGLTVNQVRTFAPVLHGNIRWSGENSAYGSWDRDDSFHLFNNHDIANVQGTPIIFVDVPEREPHDPILAISKMVATEDAGGPDVANRTLYFDFLITLTTISSNPNRNQTYKAYILDENGVIAIGPDNYEGDVFSDPEHGDYIVFRTGQQTTIHLKHGQWLSFANIEEGAGYAVTELAQANYLPGGVHTINGSPFGLSGGVMNQDFVVVATMITAGVDRVDFVNHYVLVPSTGINMGDLPYAILIGVGLGALLLFSFGIVLKRQGKKRKI